MTPYNKLDAGKAFNESAPCEMIDITQEATLDQLDRIQDLANEVAEEIAHE